MRHPIYFPYKGNPMSLQTSYDSIFQYVQNIHQIPVYTEKTYRFDYEDGNVFIINFLDPTHRNEEGVAGQHKGHKGYYPFNYVEIAPCVYFMYWLEEDYTVSQITDFNRMFVYTHYTYDENGVRKSLFHSGTITLLDTTSHRNPNSSLY